MLAKSNKGSYQKAVVHQHAVNVGLRKGLSGAPLANVLCHGAFGRELLDRCLRMHAKQIQAYCSLAVLATRPDTEATPASPGHRRG